MQMRFLQTLVEVGAENNSTIVFPVPIDLLGPLLHAKQDGRPAPSATPRRSSSSVQQAGARGGPETTGCDTRGSPTAVLGLDRDERSRTDRRCGEVRT